MDGMDGISKGCREHFDELLNIPFNVKVQRGVDSFN